MKLPPKPQARADKVSLWRYAKLFRRDILSAQPARLYRAWMRAFRFELVDGKEAMPVAHLTVRGRDGIWLKLTPR